MNTLKKINLLQANVSKNDIINKKSQKSIMGGYDIYSAVCDPERPCTVKCGNHEISVPYGNCVEIGWSSTCKDYPVYSCSGWCCDLCGCK